MAEIRSSGTWGSSLTSGEFAAIRSAGFEPVGQVFGAAVYTAGAASGSWCPASGGSSGSGMPGRSATQVPGQGSPGSFSALVQAMYQARHAAIDRMTGIDAGQQHREQHDAGMALGQHMAVMGVIAVDQRGAR